MKVFLKAGENPINGLIPVQNALTWCKVVGRPSWHVAMLFFPIVNIFYFAGMAVDMVRSFGKYSFADSAMAVIASPLYFFYLGYSDKEKYIGPSRTQEKAYAQKLKDARAKGRKAQIQKLERNNPYKKTVAREWAEAIIFAVFAAAFIRMFLIEAYKIPTSSMEESLLVGDFLFVSKAHYGIRTPMTVAMVPLLHNTIPFLGTESYLANPKLPYYRLPAIETIDQNEPIVFNYPEGDSVYVTPVRNLSVHDVRREPAIRKHPTYGPYIYPGNLRVRPIDKRDHYIKRCIALPGDKIQIIDREVHINDQPAPKPENLQFRYLVLFKDNLNKNALLRLGITEEDMTPRMQSDIGPNHMFLVLTDQQKEKLLSDPSFGITSIIPNDQYIVETPAPQDAQTIQNWGVSRAFVRASITSKKMLMTLSKKQIDKIQQADSTVVIKPFLEPMRLFPHDPEHFPDWTVDNYGPLTIPKAGETVTLKPDNIAIYRRVISTYENNDLKIEGDKFIINGEETNTYTFKQNYYWAMGDNRHNSEDSRVWGFVPEDHMVGKPLFIWMSVGSEGVRWNRIFKSASQ